MKKIFVTVIFLLLILNTPPTWAGEIERIQAKGEITVSLNRGYPPFAMENDGKLFGLDVDLAVTCIVAKTEKEMDPSYWQKEDKPGGQLLSQLLVNPFFQT
jgi:hypothetical protein